MVGAVARPPGCDQSYSQRAETLSMPVAVWIAVSKMCRWRTEAEAIVNTGSGDDWNAERMGLEARAAAAELGWL